MDGPDFVTLAIQIFQPRTRSFNRRGWGCHIS